MPLTSSMHYSNPIHRFKLLGRIFPFLVEQHTKHMVELYDGHPPPLRPSELSAIKTVSGQPLPIHGVLCTDISIAGVTYPCEFKVLDDATYQGVLGRDFLEATGAVISMENRTMQLKDRSPISFSEDLIAVIAPATYYR